MMITEEFAKRIKKLRKIYGYSQESFAKKINIDRTYIASMESGRRNVSLKNIEKIAKGLNMTISELLQFEEPICDTILLKIKNDVFLLESKENLSPKIIMEIENICHSANSENSEFKELCKKANHETELNEMDTYDIAELFKKIVQQELQIEIVFKPINLEITVWL